MKIDKLVKYIEYEKQLNIFKEDFKQYLYKQYYIDEIAIKDIRPLIKCLEVKLAKEVFNIFQLGYYYSEKIYKVVDNTLNKLSIEDFENWINLVNTVKYENNMYKNYIKEKNYISFKKIKINKDLIGNYISLLNSKVEILAHYFVIDTLKKYK